MFRTWLTLPDQSGHHRLELSVSHSTFALICNYTLFSSGDIVKCLHNTVCITIVCGDLLCQSFDYCSSVPFVSRWSPTRRRTCTMLPRRSDEVPFCCLYCYRSKRFCSIAVLCVSLTRQIVKTGVIRLRVMEGPNARGQICVLCISLHSFLMDD